MGGSGSALVLAAALGLLVLFFANRPQAAEDQQQPQTKTEEKKVPDNPFPGDKPRALPLTGGTDWLNTSGPIELSKLKGKIVLLDFWTYCCINCIHVLPELAKLEAEFPNELVVIGVHSAKFPGEKVTDNIREAIVRYGIKHPVVNDSDMLIWRSYRVRGWPTLALIDPEGYYLGQLSGEGNYELFREAIRRLVAYHEAKGTLDRTPLHFQLEEYGKANTPLHYPGKLAVDAEQNMLVVSDSSHNRVVVAELDTGKLRHVIGTGQAGLKDGPFDQAQFNDPQGLEIRGDIIYLADTKNHALRQIDLKNKTVTTIAGKGVKGYERHRTGAATDIHLASPWDLQLVGDDLYVAMAGCHQIWKMDLNKQEIGSFAGTGQENIFDGPADTAAFSQPSGLAYDGTYLYVADSEVSAVRKVHLKEKRVATVVGTGLFDFGDVDGVGDSVRLQHALGVAYKDGMLYVADTYNNKIKKIDPATRRSTSFVGDGSPKIFDEPGGIEVSGDTLYVADTNNHRIRTVNIATGEVQTLEIQGLTPPQVSKEPEEIAVEDTTELDAVSLKDSKLQIRASVRVAEGEKLNPQAPMSYDLQAQVNGQWTQVSRKRIQPISTDFTIEVPELVPESTRLRLTVTYYPCEVGSEGLCRVKTKRWEIPIKGVAADGVSELLLNP